MTDSVIAVESSADKSERPYAPTEAGSGRATGPPGGRFAYASGSRPLEGYTIKRGVGHGGFGEVYYATSDAGKEVALKLVRRNLDVELRGIKQCLNLKHPNLLAIYDIREAEDGDTWVVMEYINGESLEELLADNPKGLPVEDALRWIHGIGAGVAYLHDKGIVHRDMKPGNVFSDEGMVKIGDYGLSKFISCSRRSGQTESVGTVHYMAPEVANGRYGKEIDVYALGVMLYEMLTGRVPFEGESVGEVLMKHLTAAPDVSVLAEPYKSVVGRALEKDPTKRYRSAAEFLAALGQTPGGSPQAGPVPPPPRGAETGSAGAAARPAPQVTVAEVVPEEPIFRAVRQGCYRAYCAWNESALTTPVKILLLAIGLWVLLALAEGLVPLIIGLGVLYGIYWLVWRFAVSFTPRHGVQAVRPPPPPPAAHAGLRHGRDRRWHGRSRREAAAEALVVKPPRERTAELLGSLLGGTLVAVTMCLVMIILNSFRSDLPEPGLFAWLVMVSVAGTWAVLVPAKFWEGHHGEAMLRRFIMMVVGLALGVFAFGVAEFLRVELPYDPKFPAPKNYELPSEHFYQSGQPQLLAFVAVFGTLFLLLRWWRSADPLRGTRMSLWSMVLAMAVAWLVAGGWLFPQPWLMIVACAVSVSVQLASPWVHPRTRLARARGGEGGS